MGEKYNTGNVNKTLKNKYHSIHYDVDLTDMSDKYFTFLFLKHHGEWKIADFYYIDLFTLGQPSLNVKKITIVVMQIEGYSGSGSKLHPNHLTE